MKNESTLPEPPLAPRTIPFKKALAYSWAGFLIGAILLVDGIVMGAVFALAIPEGVPPLLSLGFPVFFLALGLVFLLLALSKTSKRKRILESGRAVRGQVLSCDPKKGWNPPPWVLTFEVENPMGGQPLRGQRWFRPNAWAAGMPEAGSECIVAVDEAGTDRAELLAVVDWQAWGD